MDSVYVIGVGMIRFNKYPDKTVQSMAHEAIELVLKDAGLTREDLEAVFFSNTFWGMFDNRQYSHYQCGERLCRRFHGPPPGVYGDQGGNVRRGVGHRIGKDHQSQ
jgi:acetyl-CoA acetyltransferase